jgi:hypothetical protein
LNLNSVNTSVVNVWKRRISNAPYSEIRMSTTSRLPLRIAVRITGRTTRQKIANEPSPRLRALSSVAGFIRRRDAATGRYTSGYVDIVMTRMDAASGWAVGAIECHA